MAARAVTILLLVALTHASIDDSVEILRLSTEIEEELQSSWYNLEEPIPDIELRTSARTGADRVIRHKENMIFSRMDHLTQMIQRIERGMELTGVVATLIAQTAGRGTELELKLQEMGGLLSRVASADRQMRAYTRLQKLLEQSTLEDFAQWCISHDSTALPGLLEKIYSLVAPPYQHLLGRSILKLVLADLQEDHPDLCELQLSPHQLIYDLYNTISLTEVKGYAMMQFSYMLLRVYGKGNFTFESHLARERYEERTSRTAAAAREALVMAKRDLIACHQPQNNMLRSTYDEVTRLLQGYVENESDMNRDQSCRPGCSVYQNATYNSCYKNKFCAQQPPCRGRIRHCENIEEEIYVCRAGQNSPRRYEWIKSEKGKTMGQVGSCTRGTTEVDYWRYGLILWRCLYCMCLCDEPGLNSDRYFSLRDSTSEIINNKVMTGVRLVKHEQVFHLQISEGTLGERGSITPGGWVPLETVDVSDPGAIEGVDYHTLSYESRAIDLDELDSPTGYILTGVRFGMNGGHLHLEIRSTSFNYTTGSLKSNESFWISNINTEFDLDFPRSQLELVRPDIPTRSATPLPVDSHHNQYVEFTHSDFEADAAQSTVPFIDIQPLEPAKGSALLSGAGLVHRGARYSGGFVAAKLLTYDYARHVTVSQEVSSLQYRKKSN